MTGKWPGQKVTNNEDIKTLANGYKVVTWTIDLKTFELSNLVVIFNNNNNNKQCPASGGWKVQDGLYYYEDGTISTTAPSEGGTTGGGTGGGGGSDTPVEWNTVTTNRLTAKPRVYTQGFYLAGDFFTFDKVDGEYKINYDDAVFKFQQQKNDATIESGKDYEVYKVEIPASLTAHAQVMYVDEFGNTKISLVLVLLMKSVKLAQKQISLKGGLIPRLMFVTLLLKRILTIGILRLEMNQQVNILMVCIICISLSMLRLMKLRSGRLCMIVTSV